MKFRFKFIFALFLCVIASHKGGFAQRVTHLETGIGQIKGTINAFERDSLGYFWIGSDKSLNRYSGMEFKTYDLKSITSSEGSGIIEILNIDGLLYMITLNGQLIKYNYEYDSFEVLLKVEKRRFLSFGKLDKDRILIGMDHGLIIFNTANKTKSETLFPETFINREILVENNLVYVATGRGCHLYRFNGQIGALEFDRDILKGKDIVSLAIDVNSRLWIGTEVDGLFLREKEETRPFLINQLEKKNYAIRKIQFDRKNKALVAIDRLGLFVIDSTLHIEKIFSHDLDDETSISQNSIYDIYVDNLNTYWLGLREGGINIIYENDNIFKQLSHVLNDDKSINNNTIRAIHESSDGALWFGTENGMSKYMNQEFINFNKNPKLFNTAVLTISEYKNHLLVGTYADGLLTFDKRKNDFVPSLWEPPVSSKWIFNISVFDENIWIANGNEGPLMHYYKDQWVHNYDVGMVRYLVQGYDGITYAGSSRGFFEINVRNNSIRRFYEDTFNNLNEIHHLNFDPLNNTIWIGATNGFYKFSLSEESLENIGSKAYDEIGTVYSIKKDNVHNLYLACMSGLWKYNIKNQLFRKFTSQDGLFIHEFGSGASAKLKDGRLAFGGPQGAIVFQPLDLEKDQPISNIYLSNFQVNGKSPDSLTLDKNINYVEDLVLNFDQNSLSFNFDAIKYHGSSRNHFEWKLVGHDQNFRDAFGNEKITYSNLKPGKYKLIAKGFNADGEKTKNDFFLDILVKKPFWKTGLAIASYFMISCFFMFLIYKVNQANVRKRFDEDRIKFFVEVAHDIRTPVSLIQLLVKQLSNQEDTEKSIELIQRNTANLNEYVTQLLDFQKIDRKQLKLSVSKVDLKECLEDIIKDFTPILQDRSIDIQLDVKNITGWFDKVKMNRIFYNMVSNAIKYSDDGGEIEIKAFQDSEYLNIEFIDNGMGIPEAQQDVIFKRFTRGTNVSNKGIPGTGIGLMLSKKIVELHGGKILLESKENIGSKFIVMLPNGSRHYSEKELVNEIKDHKKETKIDNLIQENKLILLVEDNEELRRATKKELEKDYTVIEASNGKEGLLVALSKNPDLIITDVMMPMMDGKELCNLLKTNFKTSHIPIIMLTALVEVDDKLIGLETGADHYIEKPFNVEILKATIHNLIKSRENVNRLLEAKKVTKQLTPDERFLSDIIELIKSNLTSKDFSIDILCDEMGLSRSHLFRKLKGLVQISPSDLIVKIKLNHAEELMKQKGNIRISDIAYESGFHDPKYFSTLFKKHYGKTPKEYMDSI